MTEFLANLMNKTHKTKSASGSQVSKKKNKKKITRNYFV